MKNLVLSALVALVVLFSGCKQEIDLTADYKNTPVVYGLLNSQDNTHYIRIQKGYLIDGNAYTAAGVADSIYYNDSLAVKLIPYAANGSISGQPIVFNKLVNGLPKDSGIFASNPNILYSYTGALDPAKTYKLQVVNTVSSDTFGSAELTGVGLVKEFDVIIPIEDLLSGYNFLRLSNANPYIVKWRQAENAAIYDIKLRFPYKEYNANDNSLVIDSFIEFYILKSGSGVLENNVLNANVTAQLILSNLASKLEARSDRYREFDTAEGITLFFTAGGVSLTQYINSQIAQGSGLSSNEALPPFTNIDGGYGIFSSRYNKSVGEIRLENAGLDSLACSATTSPLRFKGSNGQTCF